MPCLSSGALAFLHPFHFVFVFHTSTVAFYRFLLIGALFLLTLISNVRNPPPLHPCVNTQWYYASHVKYENTLTANGITHAHTHTFTHTQPHRKLRMCSLIIQTCERVRVRTQSHARTMENVNTFGRKRESHAKRNFPFTSRIRTSARTISTSRQEFSYSERAVPSSIRPSNVCIDSNIAHGPSFRINVVFFCTENRMLRTLRFSAFAVPNTDFTHFFNHHTLTQ